MRERVALQGGTITIASHPSRGTTVHAQLPVRRRTPDQDADAPRAISA
jgi:signal transduction histidine kinase